MAYSNDLFDLIHAMTKAEKRYFKLFSSSQSGNKEYINLFNAIAKQENYDEEKIKKQVDINALPTVKNYLYNLILRSLRSQQLNQNISLQLKDALKDVEILYQKGLYEQCSRILTRARKIAKQYEKHIHLLELCQFEHLLTSLSLSPFHRKKLIEKGYSEVRDALEAYKQLSEYRHDILTIADYSHSIGKRNNAADKKKLQQQLKPILEEEHPVFLSYKAGILFYNIKGLYLANESDLQKTHETMKNYIKHMESNPFLLTEETHNYLVGLNNLMNIQGLLGLQDEIMENCRKLRSIQLTTETERIRVIEYVLPKEVSYHAMNGSYQEGLDLLPDIEKQLEVYDNQMGKPFLLSLYTNIVELCIFAESYRKAIQWNNKILNSQEIETYTEFYSNARLSEIIIHYELNNIEKVDSLLKSFQLLLSKSKMMHQFELLLLRFLKRHIHLEGNKEILKSMKAFREELLELSKKPEEKVTFYFLDLLIWTEKKIKKLSAKK
ncbi:MAG TPA: hypothetical protein VFF27_07395 [Bacteroidia bacterium]|jgi:hypothetical protein|nr:hypothetical protein [Bacteroidia bacterium]